MDFLLATAIVTEFVPETRPETANCGPILISSTDFDGFCFIVFWVGQGQFCPHASTLTALLSLSLIGQCP